jgi:predicted phosphodiesterase
VKRDFMEGGVRFINPGSVKRPRDGSSSVAIMETRGGVLYSEFLEL